MKTDETVRRMEALAALGQSAQTIVELKPVIDHARGCKDCDKAIIGGLSELRWSLLEAEAFTLASKDENLKKHIIELNDISEIYIAWFLRTIANRDRLEKVRIVLAGLERHKLHILNGKLRQTVEYFFEGKWIDKKEFRIKN